AFAAKTRPLSKLCSTGNTLMLDDFSVFHAPADQGDAPNPNSGPGSNDAAISMAKAYGTSYQGDFLWIPSGNTGQRFGMFMRPLNMVPAPSETTLFYEARFAQAYISTQEFVAGGAFGGTPTEVPGWYDDKPKFASLFADLSAR